MNNLLTVFYRMPRLTVLGILVVLIGGMGALFQLGRQEDPTLVERFGYVLVPFPGADAERVEALIVEPLEEALTQLPEVEETQSVSRNGLAQVSFQIEETLNAQEVEDAWTLVRGQLDQAEALFPAGSVKPRIVRNYVGATTYVAVMTWEGEGDPPLAVMRRLALSLQDRFERVAGTELTDTMGLPVEQIRVTVDSDALAAAGLSVRQAAALIGSADAKAPAGRLRAEGGTIGVEVGGEFDSITRVREVTLQQRSDGSALRVDDIADVTKAFEDPVSKLAYWNDARAIYITANISPGGRVDQWAKLIEAEFEVARQGMPEGVVLTEAFNQSEYTMARLGGLGLNLLQSVGIVFIVLFLLMGWRASLIVGFAMPLTVLLVLLLFNIYGYPLHQMSVTGLVISIGILIDNAIVVADDIEQKR